MTTPSYPGLHDVERAALFAEVLDAIATGIIILDLEHEEVIFRNPHASTILEQAGADHGFGTLQALLATEIDLLRQAQTAQSFRKKVRFGNRLFGYTLYGPMAANRFVAVFLQDITDQDRLAAMDEATEMMHNIGFLFSGIRHEIGNPINSMKMALTVLRKNVHRFPPQEVARYFDRIFEQVSRMENLLTSLKTFNLFEKPRLTLVDLLAFFREFIGLLAEDVRKKHITLDLDLAEEARWVNVDVRALQHVVMNIFANAMEALSDRPDARVTVRCQSGGEVVVLTISDNGCGISKDVQQDIFKPFFTTKQNGTGLGLMLSRKLLAQMNCSLEISSKEGAGTTVTMLLPNATVNEPTMAGCPIDH